MGESPRYISVSFQREIIEAVRELIKELKYWPSAASFCREAVLEKIKKERELLKELREAERREPKVGAC